MRSPRTSVVVASILSVAVGIIPNVYGADVEVPTFELATRGTLRGGEVELQTDGEMDIRFKGGVKLGGSVALGFTSNSLEQSFVERTNGVPGSGSALTFSSASIVIREIFSLPLDFSYFIGESDEFASGEGFPEVFGTPPLASRYRGFIYFPDSIRYEGIHTAAGTGIKLALHPMAEKVALAAYVYQDGYFYTGTGSTLVFDPGSYSGDVHIMANLGKVKLEGFIGGTAPRSVLGYYRWGVIFHAADVGGEFLAQIGMPRYDPVRDRVDLDLFFLLFEARLFLDLVTLIPTVFVHPGYYKQNSTDEAGLLDFNFNIRIGNYEESLFAGGLETNLAFRKENLQDLEVKASPYITFATPGGIERESHGKLKTGKICFGYCPILFECHSLDAIGHTGIKSLHRKGRAQKTGDRQQPHT